MINKDVLMCLVSAFLSLKIQIIQRGKNGDTRNKQGGD